MRIPALLAVLAALSAPWPAAAETATQFRDAFAGEAKRENPAFAGASAQRGRAFFAATHGKEWSCASCHTPDPVTAGKHAVTGKAIAPLAPGANPERFTSAAKVEKWFRRNCTEVVGRECSAAEKADFILFASAAL